MNLVQYLLNNISRDIKNNIQSKLISVSPTRSFQNPIPLCPSCGELLNKFPNRKIKCPYCKEYIYIKFVYQFNKYILARSKEVASINYQNKFYLFMNKVDQFTVLEKQNEFRTLTAKFKGVTPSYFDIKWSLLNKKVLKIKSLYDGEYRMTLHYMADLLEEEGKYEHALKLYCQVAFYDIDYPEINVLRIKQNNSLPLDYVNELARKDIGTIWDVAPAIFGSTYEILQNTMKDNTALEQIFKEESLKFKEQLHLSLDVNKAWNAFKDQYLQYLANKGKK